MFCLLIYGTTVFFSYTQATLPLNTKNICRYASENEMLRTKTTELIRRIQAEDQSEQINKLNLLLSEIIPQSLFISYMFEVHIGKKRL